MKPDPKTEASILQQIADTLAKEFDHVDYDGGGPFLIVQDGFWFELTPAVLDNLEEESEEIDCGQCEGTGTTDAMGFAEECPVCDGSGHIKESGK